MNNPFSSVGDLVKMQKQASEMQKKLQAQRHSGKSKKGRVEIVIDGTQKILDIKIDDMLLSTEYKDELIEGIKEAMQDASKQMQKAMAKDFDMGTLRSMFASK